MGAHIAPDELNRFTNRLEEYIQNVNDETDAFKRALSDVNETWNDEKYNEFEEVFTELERVVRAFTEQAEDEVPRLRRMEEDIRDYGSR